MKSKLGLILLLFVAVTSCEDLSVEQTLLIQERFPSGMTIQGEASTQNGDQEEVGEQEDELKVQSITVIPNKATPTFGSVLPPNPDLIVSLFPSGPRAEATAEQREQKRAELDQLKKSSKFRNAALGSPTKKVKEDEAEIQNTDRSNPRLPPFAFSADDVDAKAKSAREIKDFLEVLPSTTSVPITTTTVFEDARIIESLSEESDESIDEEERSKHLSQRVPPALPPQATAAPHVIESVDMVQESSKILSTTIKTPSGEELDPIAEYNKKIVELAKKRRMIKEQGYKKYKKITFKSGRNIVPVRLFFDTDPVPSSSSNQPAESFKRSITEQSVTAKDDSIATSDKKNIVDSAIVKGKKHRPHKTVLTKTNKNPEVKKTLLIDSEFNPETTTMLSADQILLNRQANTASEDVDGSGAPPQGSSESISETQEELLSHPSPHAHTAELIVAKVNISKPSTVVKFTEDITRFGNMVKVQPARMSTTFTTTEQPMERSRKTVQEGTTEKSITEITSEILELLGESTPIPSTSTELSTEPSITIPLPPDETPNIPTSLNASRTLPPLLSMPPLAVLSSFSSLSTPVKIATRPRKPKKVTVEKHSGERKKSSGVLGPKMPLSPNNKRRKLLKHRKLAPSTTSADLQRRRITAAPHTKQVERNRFIKQRVISTSSNPTHPMLERVGHPRNRTTRLPNNQHTRPVVQPAGAASITRKNLDHRIYERTFRVVQPKRNRVRTKLQHRLTRTQFPRQQGSATDLRSSFINAKESLPVPAPRQLIATSPNPPQSPPVLTQPSLRPHLINRQPTFGPSHQQIPPMQLPVVRNRASVVPRRGSQIPLAPTLVRTMMPPLSPVTEMNIAMPQTNNFSRPSRMSEWDRIRAEFLRIKRQQKKIRQLQKQARARAVSGVKTVSEEQSSSTAERSRQTPHNGEIARGVVWREAEASNDSRALRVDVDRSRRTIDRDAIVNS